jgi:hypothetical protein
MNGRNRIREVDGDTDEVPIKKVPSPCGAWDLAKLGGNYNPR